MKRWTWFGQTIVIVHLTSCCVCSGTAEFDPYQIEWIRHFGTNDIEESESVVTDRSGNAFIAGEVISTTSPDAGAADAFLAKYDTHGTLLWSQRIGSLDQDRASAVVTNESGDVFVAGSTRNSLGGPNAGFFDGFLAKYDTDGIEQWIRQYGAEEDDMMNSLAIDAMDNLVLLGNTTYRGPRDVDGVLLKYDPEGNILWDRQIGLDFRSFHAGSLAAGDDGNLYVASTKSDFGRTTFLEKFNSTGELVWTIDRETGPLYFSPKVAVGDDGAVYLTGHARALPEFGTDLFLAEFAPDGTEIFVKRHNTVGGEEANSAFVDAAGNIIVTGESSNDVFVSMFSDEGDLLWHEVFGSSEYDEANSLTIDDSGNLYLTGRTRGELGGPLQGKQDAFIVKFSPVPEPTGLLLIFVCFLLVSSRRDRSSVVHVW